MRRSYLILFILAIFSLSMFGQPGAPPTPPGGGGDGPVVGGSEEVPLDGATLWLLLAGSALFYRKMLRKTHKNQQ